MTMNRAAFFGFVSVLWAMQPGLAQESASAQDRNVSRSVVVPEAAAQATLGTEDMGRVADRAMAQHTSTDPPLCAVLVLPGPADSFDIRFGLFNVAPDRLDVLIMNSFRALKGQSLLHQSVFDTVAPSGGTLNVLYPPDEVGKGPVVLSFTDFTQFESTAFNTDPDTYDDPNFGATVLDMDDTVIELVYSSDVPASLRCQGTLKFDPTLNASIANIVQVGLNVSVVNDKFRSGNVTTSLSSTRCGGTSAGTYTIRAKFENISQDDLFDLVFKVKTLTGGNVLCNADGGPGGVGSALTVSQTGNFNDGKLQPGEFVDVVFQIGLATRTRFTFLVDLLGVVDAD